MHRINIRFPVSLLVVCWIEVASGFSFSKSTKPWRRSFTRVQAKQSSSSLEEPSASNTVASLGAWIPIGSASSFVGLTPLPVEVMGQSLVVWENSANNWSVLEDVCPHRLVPLSQGRINQETNCLECTYHGWQFDTNGTIACIPQMDAVSTSVAKLPGPTSFPVHLTGDLIWAFLPTRLHGESFPISLLPEDYYTGLRDDISRKATYYSHELPCSWHLTLENGLDPSHFPFAHHGVIGRRSDASPMPMTVQLQNETHLDLHTSYVRQGVSRERLYSFQRPTLLYTQELVEQTGSAATTSSWKPSAKFFVVPIKEGRSRIITSVEKLTKSWVPDWITHILTGRLFKGDYFLHYAERNLQQHNYLQPTTADQGSKEWNAWWKSNGMSASPPDTFGAASSSTLQPLSRRAIMDPWRVHTQTCSKCRAVLKRARRVQMGSLVVGLVGAIRLNRKSQSIVCLLISLLVSRMAQRLVHTLEGSPHESDVLEKSWSMHLD